MTAQEIFDTVLAHLRQQDGRARRPDGACAYLALDGRRCAVGALLPAGHPAEGHDGDVDDVLNAHPDLMEVLLPGDLMADNSRDLLSYLQVLHDNKDNWHGDRFDGEVRAAQIAEGFGLRYTEPAVTA